MKKGVVDLIYGVGMSEELALSAFISLCSGAIEKPLQEQTAILGSMTIGGSVGVIENLAGLLQVCLDAGAKRILIPIALQARLQQYLRIFSASSKFRFTETLLMRCISRWR